MRFNKGSGLGAGGAIPDAATIFALKKKREHARIHGDTPDYIPMNDKKYEGRFSNANSRLVREDMDYDSSGDERVVMKGTEKKQHPALERRKKVAQGK